VLDYRVGQICKCTVQVNASVLPTVHSQVLEVAKQYYIKLKIAKIPLETRSKGSFIPKTLRGYIELKIVFYK